jgi:homoserine O-acetyltransferase
LVIGIDNDVLFPLTEQKYLAATIPGARLEVLSSLYGHDGFLADLEPVKKIVRKLYHQEKEQILL